MNLFKKIMTSVAVGAFALAVVGTGSVTASAAKGDVTIDAEKQTLTVSSQDSTINEVFVAYPKVKNNAAKAVKAWDIYDASSQSKDVVVDISNLNATKDNYVLVKTDATDVKLIKIAAVSNKVKGGYDAAKKTIVLENKTEGASGDLEYRTVSGTWDDFDDTVDLTKYEMTGATVYFREKYASTVTATEEVTIAGLGEDGADAKLTPAVAASFGGKELKIKITKAANGPKATVNLDAGTYKISKDGLEYRTDLSKDEWASDKKKNDEIAVDTSAAGVLEVRTARTTSEAAATTVKAAKATKPASKITQYTYEAAATVPAFTGGTEDVANATPNDAITFKVTAKGAKITLEVSNKMTGDDAKDIQVVTIAETGKDNAEVVAGLTAKTFKATTVKAGKTSKISVDANSYVYVRYASNKKTGAWASAFVEAGKVVAPVDPTPTPSESA